MRLRHSMTLAVLGLTLVPAAAGAIGPEGPPTGGGGGTPVIRPITEITARPAERTNASQVSYTFSANRADPKFFCRWAASADEAWPTTDPGFACGAAASGQQTATWSYSPPSDGAYHLQVTACIGVDPDYVCDATEERDSLTIDRTGPVASFDFFEDGQRVGEDNVLLFQDATTYRCSIDTPNPPTQSCYYQYRVPDLSQGQHTIYLQGFDDLGNAGPVVSRTFIYDSIVPVLTIAATPAVTNDSTPTITYSSTDEDGQMWFYCRLATGTPGFGLSRCPGDSDAGGSYTPPSPLADGVYTFTIQAADEASNFTPQVTRNITIDTVKPTIGFELSAPTGTTEDTTPTFGFTTNDSTAPFECRLSPAASFTACPNPYTPPALTPGAYKLEVRSRDAAGNVSDVIARDFTIAGQQQQPQQQTEQPRTDGGERQGDGNQQPGGDQPSQTLPAPQALITAPLRGTAKVDRKGSFTVPRATVACPAGTGDCSVTAKSPVAKASFIVKPGTSAKVKVKLSRKALKNLRRKKRLKAPVTITAVRGGAPVTKTVVVTLRLK